MTTLLKKIKPYLGLMLLYFGVSGPIFANLPPDIPMPVEASNPDIRDIQKAFVSTGTLLPLDSAQIASDIPGRIVKIHFESGAKVDLGALLIELDDTTQQAELSKAKAEVIKTEADTKRVITLFEKGTGSSQDKDIALAKLAVAKAQVEIAQASLDKTQIKAPFAGILGLKDISIGDYVSPGTTLINLENITKLKVDFNVPQIDASYLKLGQLIKISVDAYPNETFASTLSAIDPKLDLDARRIHARSILDNPNDLLKPGMFVRLSLVLEDKPNSFTVPEEAILLEKSQAFLYIIENNHAKKVLVKTGVRQDGWVEIQSGIAENDMVIVSGHMRIHDGSLVNNIRQNK